MKAKRIFHFMTLVWITWIMLEAVISTNHHRIKFLDYPCIKPDTGYQYLTCSDIPVVIDDKEIAIPQKFTTDLASIPRVFWFLVSPAYSEFIAPSILHDYLYKHPNGYSRKAVDTIFYDALLKNGVSVLTAYTMYMAVRAFGDKHYAKKSLMEQSHVG